MKTIILGSNSPRRRELLGSIFSDITIDSGTDFVESMIEGIKAEEEPMFMAKGKSHGFHRDLRDDEILLTADTVVIVDNEVLGKPKDRNDATIMLKKLSGHSHKVITAVTIRDNKKESSFSDTTIVEFSPLSDKEIDFYIEKFKPFDKAGAYGIQEWIGYIGIKSIQGSFYNVMGLPTEKVYHALMEWL